MALKDANILQILRTLVGHSSKYSALSTVIAYIAAANFEFLDGIRSGSSQNTSLRGATLKSSLK